MSHLTTMKNTVNHSSFPQCVYFTCHIFLFHVPRCSVRCHQYTATINSTYIIYAMRFLVFYWALNWVSQSDLLLRAYNVVPLTILMHCTTRQTSCQKHTTPFRHKRIQYIAWACQCTENIHRILWWPFRAWHMNYLFACVCTNVAHNAPTWVPGFNDILLYLFSQQNHIVYSCSDKK